MGLTKVGTADYTEGYPGVHGPATEFGAAATADFSTVDYVFTADTGTFAEGDVLIGLVAAGSIDANQSFFASM